MRIVQHHVKYKEIHGVDEIILMTRSTHSKLHRRLRKEGKCNVPVSDLTEISHKARRRSKGNHEYQKKIQPRIDFHELLGTNIRLRETIIYNINTGTVSYWSNFKTDHGFYLPAINI